MDDLIDTPTKIVLAIILFLLVAGLIIAFFKILDETSNSEKTGDE